jgi:hypothetical protein
MSVLAKNTINIPINHKTLFVFDHSIHFLNPSGEAFEFDVLNKAKATQTANTLDPLRKTIWTCITETVVEFCRNVFDIFPDDKLISMMISKPDLNRLNNFWNSDNGLDYVSFFFYYFFTLT